MKLPRFHLGLFALLTMLASGQAAAFSIGTYQFENADLASDLLSGSGMAYNGADYYWGSGSSWQLSTDSGWVSSAPPTEATDTEQLGATTFLAATQGNGPLGLELGFNNQGPINGGGADLAFFFLFDQTENTASLTINGVTRDLVFNDVFDGEGDQQVANGVAWDGQTLDNVRLMVGEADLADFGLTSGAAWNGPVGMELTPGSGPMAFSMAGALNTQPIPLPAALPLMLAGLSLLGWAGRRRPA
ncbi:YceI family protein [Thiohalobacter thiocyanaticus]|uniref:YceI family protein n=1 Tax=Thiohalobacter thiocyanaticus TaxID=585455 RepID=A0A426QLC5_9GAMM|nr:YceI family protein [Thiohalobacter thiocyanaticus]RRQ22573.1 YceI family protein [Thiohalobacter thiocyanaticus]